jgi:hypothetical protein
MYVNIAKCLRYEIGVREVAQNVELQEQLFSQIQAQAKAESTNLIVSKTQRPHRCLLLNVVWFENHFDTLKIYGY